MFHFFFTAGKLKTGSVTRDGAIASTRTNAVLYFMDALLIRDELDASALIGGASRKLAILNLRK